MTEQTNGNTKINITTKVYPTSYMNRQGNYIGDMVVNIDSKKMPSNNLDQVDFWLGNLLKTMMDKNEENTDMGKQEKIIPSFVKNIEFYPTTYKKVITGGKTLAKKGGRKTRRGKKSNKRRTRRNYSKI